MGIVHSTKWRMAEYRHMADSFIQAVYNFKEHVVTEQISLLVEVPPPPTPNDILGHINRSQLQ